MRIAKLSLFFSGILILQTVIFPRLNLFGFIPDLVLISIIIYSVLAPTRSATVFSAVFGLLQDILSTGFYLNTIFKFGISSLVAKIKDGYLGDEFQLSIGMVLLFTPVYIVIEALIVYVVFDKSYAPVYSIKKIVIETVYNLILMPLLFPIIKNLIHGE